MNKNAYGRTLTFKGEAGDDSSASLKPVSGSGDSPRHHMVSSQCPNRWPRKVEACRDLRGQRTRLHHEDAMFVVSAHSTLQDAHRISPVDAGLPQNGGRGSRAVTGASVNPRVGKHGGSSH